MIVCIEREGTFAVGWQHSHNHQCGNVGLDVLKYRVCIKADPTNIGNDEGYILDNNDLPRYFKTKYAHVKDFVSCEHIVQVAVRDFEKMCKANKVWPLSIKVSVQGITDSWISAEQEYPQR